MAKNNDFSEMDTGKKDTGVNEGAASVEIERSKSTVKKQIPASKQEAEARRESMKTQGIKGAKMDRINMAFTPSNHQFLRIMSTATGMSMTEIVNTIIQQYQDEHGELYREALDVYKKFKGEL